MSSDSELFYEFLACPEGSCKTCLIFMELCSHDSLFKTSRKCSLCIRTCTCSMFTCLTLCHFWVGLFKIPWGFKVNFFFLLFFFFKFLLSHLQDAATGRRHLLSSARARRRGPWSRWVGSHGWSRATLRLSWLHARPVPGGLGGVRRAERVAGQPGPHAHHFRLNNPGHAFMHILFQSPEGGWGTLCCGFSTDL